MRNRFEEIKAKGFDMANYRPPVNFSNIKVGMQTLEDAILTLGSYKKANKNVGDKAWVLKAISDGDIERMREISDFYFKTCGIYSRILRYMAYMYKYDWFVAPEIKDKNMKEDKIIEMFRKCLNILDNSHIKKIFGEIALKVLRHGAYYGYRVEQGDGYVLQELPVNYCRSRYKHGNKPAVEFKMKYFDDYFTDKNQRDRILKMFPKEFQKGYNLYKAGKLKPDFAGDDSGWYLLDPIYTVRFTLNDEEYPPFIAVIPLIIDLDEAQDLNKKKMMQRLLRIVIQKMPLDKNGDLVFDIEEAQQLHNNAVQMLGKAINTDVLTTFADVEVASFAENSASAAASDDLDVIERQLYNEAGVSYLQFNTNSSAALDRSIENDASTMYNLLLQFEEFLNELLDKQNKNKKIHFYAQILTTTIYNYKEISKLYKEQMQIGFSKMLPQIALGQTQSSILNNAYFENDILNLINIFIPPLMSSTMNENILDRAMKNKVQQEGGGEGAGRKTNEEKGEMQSEKTIANRESM